MSELSYSVGVCVQLGYLWQNENIVIECTLTTIVKVYDNTIVIMHSAIFVSLLSFLLQRLDVYRQSFIIVVDKSGLLLRDPIPWLHLQKPDIWFDYTLHCFCGLICNAMGPPPLFIVAGKCVHICSQFGECWLRLKRHFLKYAMLNGCTHQTHQLFSWYLALISLAGLQYSFCI